jgi:CubicO group peptidase (beta-lactamase class C family)
MISAALLTLGLVVAQARDPTLVARVDSDAAAESRAGFSGIALIAHGDTVVLDKAYGNAAAAGSAVGAPAFWLASNSKQFTAAADDVHRWIQALRRGSILSGSSVHALLGRHVLVREDKTGQSFAGYGWGVRVEQGRDVSYGHVGDEDWLGHNAIMRFTP